METVFLGTRSHAYARRRQIQFLNQQIIINRVFQGWQPLTNVIQNQLQIYISIRSKNIIFFKPLFLSPSSYHSTFSRFPKKRYPSSNEKVEEEERERGGRKIEKREGRRREESISRSIFECDLIFSFLERKRRRRRKRKRRKKSSRKGLKRGRKEV